MEWIALFIHFPVLLSFIIIFTKKQNKILLHCLTGFNIAKEIFKNRSFYVSIVIPTFNRALLLNRSLTISQFQTLTNIEIICVDDCSTDWTRSLIIERMKKDPRIKLVQNLYNQGVILSRFNGVFSSAGTYILTLDSDDLIYSNTSEIAYKFSIMHNADIIDYKAANIGKDKKVISDNWRPCGGSYNGNVAVKKALKKGIDINLWKKFIKRSIFINAINFIYPYVRDKKICYAEDDIIVGSVLLFSSNFFCTNIPAYIHFMDQDISVESGKLQTKKQNDLQVKYANQLLNYLYGKSDYRNCNVIEFFRDKTNLDLFLQLNTVTDKTIKTNCSVDEKIFVHHDYIVKGYCVILKKK